MELKRISVKLPEHVQEYYREQGKKYNVPYSNYIAMVLTQLYENDKNAKLLADFNETLKTLKNSTGELTAEDMLNEMKAMVSEIKEMEK